MIYGQDEPVALPVMDLYDTGMMQMYVNAARDQYLQAREDQKEFLKTYGDFLSPIQNDMNYWYNNTINPVNKMMNEAAERGIDLTRSTEGRALLARTLNNLPYAELAKVRQSAKDADQYLKNRAELESKGLWSPEYENWILKQEGLPSFENWDSTKNGVWNRISPAAYQDLNSATKHWYDQLKDSYIETKDGYDWFGITKGDLEKTTASNLSDFVGGNLGKFFLEKAKQELIREGNANPTVAQQLDRLKSNIVVANKELTHRNRNVNDYTMLDKKFAQDLKKLAIQHAYDKEMEDIKFNNDLSLYAQKKKIEKDESDIPLGFITQTTIDSNQKYSNVVNKNYNNYDHVTGRTALFWKDQAENRYKQLQKILPKGDPNTWNARYNSLSPANKKKYDKLVYRYRQDKKHQAWWESANRDGIQSAGKYGLIKNGKYTGRYNNAFEYSQGGLSSSAFNKKPNSGLKDAETIYDRYVTVPQGVNANTARNILTNNSKEYYFPGGRNKYSQIDLSSSEISYTPIRRMSVAGRTRFKYNDVHSQFARFLKRNKRQGYLVNPEVHHGIIGNQYDVSGYATISVGILDDFARSINAYDSKGDGKDLDELKLKRIKLANKLGIVLKSMDGRIAKNVSDKIDVIDIPVTRTVDLNNAQRASAINEMHDKNLGGSGAAAKRQTYRNETSPENL